MRERKKQFVESVNSCDIFELRYVESQEVRQRSAWQSGLELEQNVQFLYIFNTAPPSIPPLNGDTTTHL